MATGPRTSMISHRVQINEDAVRRTGGLEYWSKMLDLGVDDVTPAPNWETVYEAIARVWIGAVHYQRFCKTAIDDIIGFEQFILNEDSVTVSDQAKPSVPDARATKAPAKHATKSAAPKAIVAK